MRIAVGGPVFPDSFADNIIDSLRRMGHQPIALGPVLPRPSSRVGNRTIYTLYQMAAPRAFIEAQWLRRVRSAEPDLVLNIETSLGEPTVAAVRKLGIPIALWFPDAIVNFNWASVEAPYSAIFSKDPVLIASCPLGTPIHFMAEACNPSWHRPIDGPRDPCVVVAGNMYPTRVLTVENLIKANVPVKVYGPRWALWIRKRVSPGLAASYTGRYVAREEKARVFRSAAVVLNNLHPQENGLNCRLFEAAACGATVLCEQRDDLPRFFDDTEVASYSSVAELVEKARFFVDNADDGMGDRAAARAARDHTYDIRLAEVIDLAVRG